MFHLLRDLRLCPDDFHLFLLYFALVVERFCLNDFRFIETRIVARSRSVAVQHVLTDGSPNRLRAHLNVVHLFYVEIYDFVQRVVEPVVFQQFVNIQRVRDPGVLRVFVRGVVLSKLDADERYVLAFCELHNLLSRAVAQSLHLFHDREVILIE